MDKHPGGAPRKPFDWNFLDSLAILDADLNYIAERMVMAEEKEVNKKSIETKVKFINRRINERFGCSYVQYREQKKEIKRIKLRQIMWKTAESGNVTMQIWLSKQYLGMSDKLEERIDHTTNGKDISPVAIKEPLVELPPKGFSPDSKN